MNTVSKYVCGYRICPAKIGDYGRVGTALSRHDNKTLICSDCGMMEALNPKYRTASLLRTTHATLLETVCDYSDCETRIYETGVPGHTLSIHNNKSKICPDCGLKEMFESKPETLLRSSKRHV